jgi:hypothetical protein
VLAAAQISLGPVLVVGMASLFVLSSLGRAAMAFVFWKTL